MATEAPMFIGEFLSEYFRESVVLAILAGVVLLRFRRYRAVAAAGAGAAGSAATIAVAVLVSLMAIIALGYWDPPVSHILRDAVGAGQAVWSLAGEWLVEQTVGRLNAVAE